MRRRRRLAPVLARVALAGLAVLAFRPRPPGRGGSPPGGRRAFEDGSTRPVSSQADQARLGWRAAMRRPRGGGVLDGAAAEALRADAARLPDRRSPGELIFWQGEALFRLRRLDEARTLRALLAPGPPRPTCGGLYARSGRAFETALTAHRHVPDFSATIQTRARRWRPQRARELIRRGAEDARLLGPYAKVSEFHAETRHSRRRPAELACGCRRAVHLLA
jgi:hypothetical protein